MIKLCFPIFYKWSRMKLHNCHPHMRNPHIIQKASRGGPNGPTKAGCFFLSRHSCPLWPPQCFFCFKSKLFKSNVHVFLTVSDNIRWTSQIIPGACKRLDVYQTSTICRSFLHGFSHGGKPRCPAPLCLLQDENLHHTSLRPVQPVAAGYDVEFIWGWLEYLGIP